MRTLPRPMLFNSHVFILVFLPLVTAGFFAIARLSPRAAAAWLTLASFFFYGWWDPRYVVLLLASASFNFAAGLVLARRRSSLILALAVGANLAVLGYFKYADFFLDTLNRAAGSDFALLHIVLPIGISFYTFTQIAYLVDVRRGIARDYHFVHYLLFVSYFPHLIAGPLLHHKQMMPQFDDPSTYRPRAASFEVGLALFAIGLFKKTVLADQFALYATPVFEHAAQGHSPGFWLAWGAALAYTLQLYFDFSGYSEMALGISRLFNVKLPVNFYSPYRSPSIIEFWRRWHMTLSAFLRDYLYIPLGGNRHGRTRRYANLMITMLLGGLWHGANWTFVAWGGLHGAYLVANHAWRSLRERWGWRELPMPLAVAITFVAVVVAWVVFRAPSLHGAWSILRGMAGLNGWDYDPDRVRWLEVPWNRLLPSQLAWTAAGLAIVFLARNAIDYAHRLESGTRGGAVRFAQGLAIGVLLFAAFKALSAAESSPFLYFQF